VIDNDKTKRNTLYGTKSFSLAQKTPYRAQSMAINMEEMIVMYARMIAAFQARLLSVDVSIKLIIVASTPPRKVA